MGPAAIDPTAFHAFERAGWESIPLAYQDAFGTLTTQAIGPLLDAACVGPGVRVLDVATGPGYVAAAAAARGTMVVGVDFSAAMLTEARRHSPSIDFREGDAEDLPAHVQKRLEALPGQKNVLIRVTMRAPERTLTDCETNEIRDRLLQGLRATAP